MKIRYVRVFEQEVPDEIILEALKTRIEEWQYDDDEERKEMGIEDVIHRLDRDGHLQDEELISVESDDYHGFNQDFYTYEELEKELQEREES